MPSKLTQPQFFSILSTFDIQVIVASVLLWLWRNHEECFQKAFTKSGRIDVDPECKWLIHTAIDTSVRALSLEVADAISRGNGPLAAALGTRKGSSGQKSGADSDRSHGSPAKLDLLTAAIVSKSLMAGLSIDGNMVSITDRIADLPFDILAD
jgi:hypothetical protein